MTTRTLASCLNKRIVLETPLRTPDGCGGYSTIWQEFASLWAEAKEARFALEQVTQAQLQSKRQMVFTIRTLEGVLPTMRVQYQGRQFTIRALRYGDTRETFMELYTEEENV